MVPETSDEADPGPDRVEALTNAAWFTGIVCAVFVAITLLSGFDPGAGLLLLTAATGIAFVVVLVLRARAVRRSGDRAEPL